MNTFALRSANDRAEVFEETAARMGIGRPAIVEKDYWVCSTLSKLYGQNNPLARSKSSHPLLFKGGTSLSKVYGLIDRFSEDIDLTIDRAVLVDQHESPDQSGISNRERKRRIDRTSERCTVLIREHVAPYLQSTIDSLEGGRVTIDERDPQTIHVTYPHALSTDSYGGGSYVNAEVRLEFGARGELWPAEAGEATAYVAVAFPNLFVQPRVPVWALSVQRTFWEKATILHAIANSGRLGKSERQSRHYADLVSISRSTEGQIAIANTQLLVDVADHKAAYFPMAAARYDRARPGTLRLSPPRALVRALQDDYERMKEMFISSPPEFAEVMADIRKLELLINEPSRDEKHTGIQM